MNVPKGANAVTRGFVARPWLLVFLPVNAATTSFSVALPLIILFTLHAGVLVVALAAALYNSAIIPASLLWGLACDRLKVRAPFLLLNYASFAVVFVALALLASIPVLLVMYTIYGLVAPASAAASNLLILERFPASERPTAFASFSELGMLGSVLGLLVGFLWTLSSPSGGDLLSLLYAAAALSAASALGVALFIRDAPELRTRAHLARHPEALAARLRSTFPYFPHHPGRRFFQRAAQWLREEATHEVPLMLAGGFLFNLASNLFNTSYTPYLTFAGLSAAGIFLVNISNNGAQALFLPFTGRASEGLRAERVVAVATWVRVAGYLGVAALVLLPPALAGGGRAFGPNLLAFGVLGVAFAFYSTASSLLLFRSLEGRNAGSLIGANSALGGLAAVLGAASSGVLSAHFGYFATFLVAGLAMITAVPVWLLALRAYHARQRPLRASPSTAPSAIA